jgi:hypothetical protein
LAHSVVKPLVCGPQFTAERFGQRQVKAVVSSRAVQAKGPIGGQSSLGIIGWDVDSKTFIDASLSVDASTIIDEGVACVQGGACWFPQSIYVQRLAVSSFQYVGRQFVALLQPGTPGYQVFVNAILLETLIILNI